MEKLKMSAFLMRAFFRGNKNGLGIPVSAYKRMALGS